MSGNGFELFGEQIERRRGWRGSEQHRNVDVATALRSPRSDGTKDVREANVRSAIEQRGYGLESAHGGTIRDRGRGWEPGSGVGVALLAGVGEKVWPHARLALPPW